MPRAQNAQLYAQYKELADTEPAVHFVGRLATYKYYNMDQITAQALSTHAKISGNYNDGFVMPLALDRETVAAIAPRADRFVKVYSRNYDECAEFDLDGAPHRQGWVRYVEGVALVLESRGVRLRGADLIIDSDVPLGAGLSSSSALEISVELAFLSDKRRKA